MKQYLVLWLCLPVFLSCRDEIDLPYRSVEPLYVIEGKVSNEVTEVFITQTKDIKSGEEEEVSRISDATVTVLRNGQTSYRLYYNTVRKSYYTGLMWRVGDTYKLTVKIGDQEFTSDSQMYAAVTINDLKFRWLKFMNEKTLYLHFTFNDIADETNYYCYRVRRNGMSYRWNVLNDEGYNGLEIPVNVACMTEKQITENKEEDQSEILNDGDKIEVEVQSIDRRTYHYLYSLELSERSLTNPIHNFTGGCLGYFSAYGTVRKSTVFDAESAMLP